MLSVREDFAVELDGHVWGRATPEGDGKHAFEKLFRRLGEVLRPSLGEGEDGAECQEAQQGETPHRASPCWLGLRRTSRSTTSRCSCWSRTPGEVRGRDEKDVPATSQWRTGYCRRNSAWHAPYCCDVLGVSRLTYTALHLLSGSLERHSPRPMK